jgi:hypothetical protein
MTLAELQRSLAASLLRSRPAPAGVQESQVIRARAALLSKRRQAVTALLPTVSRELGRRWASRFRDHARDYSPAGMLYHVDDAWELASRLRDSPEPALRTAARQDLLHLSLRYVRNPRRQAGRVRPRWAPFIARDPWRSRALVVRLPGRGLRVWRVCFG